MASIETPCIRVCVVHPSLRLCTGCGRSLDEIARWIDLTADERGRIMTQLPPRLAAMSGANSGANAAPANAALTTA
jgi:predicted Fe-S protein YdhL (DUF1289 family)